MLVIWGTGGAHSPWKTDTRSTFKSYCSLILNLCKQIFSCANCYKDLGIKPFWWCSPSQPEMILGYFMWNRASNRIGTELVLRFHHKEYSCMASTSPIELLVKEGQIKISRKCLCQIYYLLVNNLCRNVVSLGNAIDGYFDCSFWDWHPIVLEVLDFKPRN